MSEIPQPVNIQSRQLPVSPTRHPREHGLRIHVPEQQHEVAEEISPITPQASLERVRDENPVSPIDTPKQVQARDPLPEGVYPSQIPRKTSKASQEDEKVETRWDAFSGEPTKDQSGQPSAVRPGAQPVELQYPHLKERTKQILAGLREREAAKQKKWGKVPPPVQNDTRTDRPQREPWKGPSGRTAILEPVRNNPAARQQPLQLPERSALRSDMTVQSETPVDTQVATAQMPRSVNYEEDIKPVVPLKSAKRNKSQDSVVLNKPATPAITPEPCHPLQSSEPIIMHARVDSPPYDPEPTTPTTPTAFSQPELAEKSSELSLSDEPPDFEREQSRLSWTTYTTSADGSSSSPLRAVFDSSPPLPSAIPPPINIRKRPVSASVFANYSPLSYNSPTDSSFNGVARKPLPKVGGRASIQSTAASRAASTSKSLPPTPTIIEATDKIENLAAQLEALNRRKYNVSRIIRDLEESLKKNAIIYDMWKRREVEKNIVNHKLALDEISSDIHEISIQLHRAQRKRDREDNYEACTGLWIKRVTS